MSQEGSHRLQRAVPETDTSLIMNCTNYEHQQLNLQLDTREKHQEFQHSHPSTPNCTSGSCIPAVPASLGMHRAAGPHTQPKKHSWRNCSISKCSVLELLLYLSVAPQRFHPCNHRPGRKTSFQWKRQADLGTPFNPNSLQGRQGKSQALLLGGRQSCTTLCRNNFSREEFKKAD